MAIEIPTTVGFKSRSFDLRHAQQVTNVGGSGFIQTINRSAPFWTAEYETPPMNDTKENEARVFLDSLEGAMNTFLAYDPKRIMPQAYKGLSEGSAPWGTPTITGYDYANSNIDLASMTVGAQITKGDYISVEIDDVWYLFRAMQSVTVGVGGTVADLIVRPRPNFLSFSTTAIRYIRACCEMKMIGEPKWADEVGIPASVQFAAGQFVNRVTV